MEREFNEATLERMIEVLAEKADNPIVFSSCEKGITVLKFEKTINKVLLNRIKSMVFFTTNISVKNTDLLLKQKNDTIEVNLNDITLFRLILEKLKELKAKVFTAEFQKNEIQFWYTLSDKRLLLADDLDKIQELVNPEIELHDSIRVCYDRGVSCMRIMLWKTPEFTNCK